MLLDSVRNLLRLHAAAVEEPTPAVAAEPTACLVPDPSLAADDDPQWPSARIAVAEALWGEGSLFPGGGEEVLRLAKPLGLTEASSLLLLGAGTGGAPRRISAEFGVWVTGYDSNAHLAELANERSQRAGLGRRAQVEVLDPNKPAFPPHYYHHCIALEPLRGSPPEPLLTAVAKALKPSGHLVLLEAVADRPLDPAEPTVAAWARLDHRPATAPTELAVTAALRHLGFDVRIAEDISRRQIQQALQGWRDTVQTLRGQRPNLRQLSFVVREAELWLARVRLMRGGRLRLVRWHAIGRG